MDETELRNQLPSLLAEYGLSDTQLFTCINPNHDDKHPSMSYDAKHNQVHCFSCQVTWSIFDVWAVLADNAIPDANGKPIYDFKKIKAELITHFTGKPVETPKTPDNDEIQKQNKLNEYLTQEIKNAQARLSDPEAQAYLKSRGISIDTAKKFKLGYSPSWINPKKSIMDGETTNATPRLIIPTSANSYLARDIRSNIPDWERNLTKIKQGQNHLFNLSDLKNDSKPIYIVEGEIDAMSIYEVAGDAVGVVGLGSVSMKDQLLKAIGSIKNSKGSYNPTFLIATDNDPAGDACSNYLLTNLNKLGYEAYRVDIFQGAKDPNEALTVNRASFQKAVLARAVDPEDYLNGLKQRLLAHTRESNTIGTGFTELDNQLNGGLMPSRLYVLGAISSLGKTTLAIQLAKNLAQKGQDVLYFSLESSKDELVEKIISSETFTMSNGHPKLSQTAHAIDKGTWLTQHTEASESIELAFTSLEHYFKHLTIIDGMADRPTTETIEREISRQIDRNKKPIVFVDYLQLLKSTETQAKMTDKGAVTDKVSELKKMTAKYNIPVIVISSFNRASYYTQVGYDSFKESGEIEYTADVLWGLQYTAMDDISGSDDARKVYRKASKGEIAEGANPVFVHKRISVHTIKNRQGGLGQMKLEFYPAFNVFLEMAKSSKDDAEPDQQSEPSQAKPAPKGTELTKTDVEYKLYHFDGTTEAVTDTERGQKEVAEGKADRLVAVVKGSEKTIKQATVKYELHYKPDDQGELIPATDYLQAREKVTKGDAYSLMVLKPNGEKELIAQYDQPDLLK